MDKSNDVCIHLSHIFLVHKELNKKIPYSKTLNYTPEYAIRKIQQYNKGLKWNGQNHMQCIPVNWDHWD